MLGKLMHALDINDPRWAGFVTRCPDALPVHLPAWADLLAKCYGFRPFALTVMDQAGQITAGLPVLDVSSPLTGRRWVSLPFTDYCPLLMRGEPMADVVDALANEVRSRRLDVFEQRASLPQWPRLYHRAAAVRHTLALSPNPDVQYGYVSKMHQRNIRKAQRAKVQIRHGHTAGDVDTFYRLHLLTRRRLGVPIQPRRFFDLVAQRLIASGMGFVLSAHVDCVPVAAAIFLAWNDVMIYKYGASDPRFWGYRPNNMLFWQAICWGCENGFRTFDWGRSGLRDHGLRAFKAGWGATEEPLTYSIIGSVPSQPSADRLKGAMGFVIRRSPPWVCQAIGEHLYRYVA